MNAKNLKIYYQNIRGVNTKTHIRSNFSAAKYELIALTETWMSSDLSSSELFDDSFTVHRSDRNLSLTNKKRGGGCLIAIKSNISAIRMTQWEQELPYENVWLAINQKKSNKKLFINVIYIPPNASHETYSRYFDHYANLVCNAKPDSEFIILGDFNISTISWVKIGSCCTASSHEGKIASDLLNTLEISELKQFNNITNSNGRILDLTLSNLKNLKIFEAEALSKPDPHHPTFCLEISNSDTKFLKTLRAPKVNFHKLDYNLISHELDKIDWDILLAQNNIDDAVDIFYITINRIIEKYSKLILPKNNHYPKWFSANVIKLLSEKENYRDLHRKTGLNSFNELYKIKRKLFKSEKDKCEKIIY